MSGAEHVSGTSRIAYIATSSAQHRPIRQEWRGKQAHRGADAAARPAGGKTYFCCVLFACAVLE